jgi:hypothetical protein
MRVYIFMLAYACDHGCIYVCLCNYIHIYASMYINISIVYIYIYMCVYVYVYVCIYVWIRMCVYVDPIFMNASMCACIYYIYTRVIIYIYICMYTCLYIHVHFLRLVRKYSLTVLTDLSIELSTRVHSALLNYRKILCIVFLCPCLTLYPFGCLFP